ncbi:MAG TPA: aminotransferase class V-fold PLP-dependent enzyme, partial [Candidatus Dormibacteraeota bacterium]|nr:aminotransferase class V-fold PLP-dependent enzyme [Candidatus Dormibacteraeota bacterium]
VGRDLEVPLASGELRRYANLDYAASTPAMEVVRDALLEVLPWYSSVHRGSGFASQATTHAYETARQAVAAFVGARSTDTVIFVRNTTEAVNLVARCVTLHPDHVVLSTMVEHHANMLPWRRLTKVVYLDPPASPATLIAAVKRALEDRSRPVGLVAMTGASNVTGEVFPLREIGHLAHAHGALFAVDAAQLAPHRAIDMQAMNIDFLSFSGHKMYAPFGAGALVAPSAVMGNIEPMLAGGGAVDFVTLEDVQWTSLPDRHEAGTPNVLGAIALAAAATALQRTGFDRVQAHERRLLSYLDAQLDQLPRISRYRLWTGANIDRLGISTFGIAGMSHALVAAALSAEHGVGVRHGCFCAHPYITHLLGITYEEAHGIREQLRRGEHHSIPGAVRASFGIGTTIEDVDRLIAGLAQIIEKGPKLTYTHDPHTGDFIPDGDRRTLPALDFMPVADGTLGAAGCGQF